MTHRETPDMGNEKKMQDALQTRRRRLDPKADSSVFRPWKGQPLCEVRLDRLRIASTGFPMEAILNLSGFRRTKSQWLKRRKPKDFLAYRRLTRFESTTSVGEMCVLTERQSHRLAQCMVTLIAEDKMGLRRDDVRAILELLPSAKFKLVELAWDFRVDSGVNGAFIRAHGLFGKSRRRRVADIQDYDSWGSRK